MPNDPEVHKSRAERHKKKAKAYKAAAKEYRELHKRQTQELAGVKIELENKANEVAKLLAEVATLEKGGRDKDTTIMSLDASRAGVSGFYHKFAKDSAGLTLDEQMHAAVSRVKCAEDSFKLNQAYLKIVESKYASEQERTKTLMREIKALGGDDMFKRNSSKHLQFKALKDRTEICTVEFAVENPTICTSGECHIRRLHQSDLKKRLAVDLKLGLAIDASSR